MGVGDAGLVGSGVMTGLGDSTVGDSAGLGDGESVGKTGAQPAATTAATTSSTLDLIEDHYTQPTPASPPPPHRPTAVGLGMPEGDPMEPLFEAIDKMTIAELRRLTVRINLLLEFKGRRR